MMLQVLLFLCLVGSLQAATISRGRNCAMEHMDSGLSMNYGENVGHAIHKSIDWGLPFFNPRVSALRVKTYLFGKYNMDSAFATEPIKILDYVMNMPNDLNNGEKFAYFIFHGFHLLDLLETIRQEYNASVAVTPPSRQVCSCLLDMADNGIEDSLKKFKQLWAGNDLPSLAKPGSWVIWKERAIKYYSKPALRDSAMFLHCATMKL